METTTEQKTADREEKPEWAVGEVSLIYNEEAGTQILQHQDSQIDYCSISSQCSPELLASDCSSAAGLASSASQSSAPPPADPEETGRDQDRDQDRDRDQDQQAPAKPESDPDTAETVNPTPPQLQAFTVLPVNGSLWIPRRGGDLMVIEMQSHNDQLRGRVTAVLSPPGGSSLGILQEAALVAKDTVVCGFHKENMEWCLCVWRGWGSRELEVFYQSYEELGRLESGMRKRR